MKEILRSYETLMLFRMNSEPELKGSELRDILDGWYRIRRAAETKPEPVPAEGEEPALRVAPAEASPEDFKGYGAKLKRETLKRVEKLRGEGRTLTDIVEASKGAFALGQLTQMLNCEKVPIKLWDALAAALDRMEDGA